MKTIRNYCYYSISLERLYFNKYLDVHLEINIFSLVSAFSQKNKTYKMGLRVCVCVCVQLWSSPINFHTSYAIDTKFWLHIVHRCGGSGSMGVCHAAGPGSIPGRDRFPG